MRKKYKYQKSGSVGVLRLFIPLVALVLIVAGILIFLPRVFQGKFEQTDRFNVSIDGRREVVMSLSTKGEGAVVVLFPDNLYFPGVAHGYGQYPVSKIYQVGELDGRGGEVFADSMSQYLGIPIEGNVHSNRNFSSLKNYVVNPDFIFNDKSSIDLWDRLKIAKTVWGLRFDKIYEVDLGDHSEKIILTDGSKAVSLDTETVDKILQNLFTEKSLLTEKLRVSVFNSTETAGLGEMAARILGNIGISVVSVETDPELKNECVLLTSQKLMTSLTAVRIAAIFHCQIKEWGTASKSDITVIIGQNFADSL